MLCEKLIRAYLCWHVSVIKGENVAFMAAKTLRHYSLSLTCIANMSPHNMVSILNGSDH